MVNTVDSLGRLLPVHSADSDATLAFLFSPDNPLRKTLTSLTLKRWTLGKNGLEAIGKIPNLTALDLSGWRLQVSQGLALKALKPLSGHLELLTLSNCGLTLKLLDGFTSYEKLRYLNVSRNGKSLASLAPITDLFRNSTQPADNMPEKGESANMELLIICDENDESDSES